MDSISLDSQALPPGTHLHEFVIERVLGSGGFGITYLARDTGLSRQVVIKENLPSQFAWRETASGTVRPRHTTGGDIEDYQWSMKNFLREAETLASLDHPGIVRVLRKFETNGTAYFVMPFVEGAPFDSLIEDRSSKNKPFSQDELLGLTTRVLDALGYLHRSNIYHRDIKPGNILITNEGVPVLIDFGSARQSLGERSLTVIESPGYTPFEQLQSHGNIGPWSDLYALGATLAKAITFRSPPKAADRMMGDPWHGLSGDPALSSYSDWFLQSIDRSMAVDPANRWQDAYEWKEFFNGGANMPGASSADRLSPPIQPLDSESQKHQANTAITRSAQSPPIPVGVESIPNSAPPQSTSWEESYVASHCPHCGQSVRFQMKAFKKNMLKCIFCGKGIVPSSLTELHPEDGSRYPVSLNELLFSYKGRVGRKEYWLLNALPGLALLFVAGIMAASGGTAEVVGGFLALLWVGWSIFVCIPITAKRLHDHDMSGHLIWLLLIPYFNTIIAIWFLIRLGMMPGKNLANKYGPPISQLQTPLNQ